MELFWDHCLPFAQLFTNHQRNSAEKYSHLKFNISLTLIGKSLEFCVVFAGKRRNIPCPSVTSSSHTSVARGLKIGMHNPYMDGSKVTVQFFDILLRS